MWCNRPKLLSANWMNPVNATAVDNQATCGCFLESCTLPRTRMSCFTALEAFWWVVWPPRFLNTTVGVWLAGLLGMCPFSWRLTGQQAVGVTKERRNVRRIMSEGGSVSRRHLTGTIKANQSTCWEHSQDSYWVTLLAWIFFKKTCEELLLRHCSDNTKVVTSYTYLQFVWKLHEQEL